MTIKDLLDENGEFLDHKAIAEKYGITVHFIEILGIQKAILHKWHKFLKEENNELDFIDWYTKLLNNTNITHYFYSKFNANDSLIYKIINLWSNIFNIEDIQRYNRNLYITSNVPKFRSFQYRFISHKIITNQDLHHFKIKTNDL